MTLQQKLIVRNDGKCELCNKPQGLAIHEVAGATYSDADGSILICTKCLAQIDKKEELDPAHVRNIRLVPDNTDQIEGRIEGQQIVILTKFVRKQN